MRHRLLLISISPAALLVILVGPFVQVGVAQLSLPASLVGGLVALQMLLSGLRPWLGRLGDRHPAGSTGRRTLLKLGLVLTWGSLPLLLLGLVQLGRLWPALGPVQRAMALAAEAGVMVILGLGNQLSQTMQGALLLEPLPLAGRRRMVQRLWILTNLLTVVASGLSALLLQGLSRASLNQQLIGLWALWLPIVALTAGVALGGRMAPPGEAAIPPSQLATSASSGLFLQAESWRPQRSSASSASPTQAALPAAARTPLWKVLQGGLLPVLLFAHAPLYAQDVLLDPWATLLFGWPLAATTSLTGSWALGTLLGQLWALRWPISPRTSCMVVASLYGLFALRGWPSGLPLLPIPVLVAALGLASGWLQLWLAGEVGNRCGGGRIGETVGWLGAALVLSRSLGVACGGPLLDAAAALTGGRGPTAFALAFGSLSLLMAVGGWSCRRLTLQARPAPAVTTGS